MDALDDKKALTLCVYDLAKTYNRKYPQNDGVFIIKCCELALQYFPNSINVLMFKAETLKQQFKNRNLKPQTPNSKPKTQNTKLEKDPNTFDFITTGYNSDITNIGGTLTIRNSMLQSDYPCTACVSKNNKNPIFKNIFNPRGVDGKFRTSDDGLTFNCGSPAINKGNNTFVVGSIDLIGQPRMTDVVDLGAYESNLNTPLITTQPARQDVCEGTSASFSVVVAGTRPVTYQWQSRYYSGTFANITGATSVTTDNTIHIIVTEYLDNTTIIDGFTFTSSQGGTYGGAILNFLSAPIISNCVFSNNDLGMLNSESNPIVSDCRFENGFIGMLNEEMTGVLLNRCVFSKNQRAIRNFEFVDLEANGCVFDDNDGGGSSTTGVDNEDWANTILNSCVFSNNRSSSTNGVVLSNNSSSSLILNNCTFYKNECTNNGNIGNMISSGGGVLRIRNSIFYNNAYDSGGGNKVYTGNSLDISAFDMQSGKFTIENSMLQSQQVCPTCPSFNNRYPQFADTVNLIGPDLKWGTNDDGLRLACTATASNIGNNTYATATDIIGNPRIQFSTIDLGAYEGTALGAVVRTHPQNARICLGTTATFFVEAVNGTGVTYQWQEDAGTGYRNMTGATQATLSIPSVS